MLIGGTTEPTPLGVLAMLDIVFLALGLGAYLVYTLLYPERF